MPDVSVYLELCEILGISLNEFLAGEDIERDNIEKKSEDTLIQITKDSGRKQRYLKRIIIVLLIVVGISMVTFGSIVLLRLTFSPSDFILLFHPFHIQLIRHLCLYRWKQMCIPIRDFFCFMSHPISNGKCCEAHVDQQGNMAMT